MNDLIKLRSLETELQNFEDEKNLLDPDYDEFDKNRYKTISKRILVLEKQIRDLLQKLKGTEHGK